MSSAAAPTEVTPATALPLRRNRDFRLLWIGQALSDFGSAMTFVALPLVLLQSGYSASAVGTIGTVTLLTAMAVRVPAGYVTDRFDSRRLMLGCDLVRLVLVAAVAAYTFAGRLPITVAVVSVVVAQVAMEVFRPSQNATVRRVVPAGQLASAISLNQARAYAADIAAPAAAGLLIVVTPGTTFAFDAATFAVSALCVTMLSRARAHGRQAGRRTDEERFLARLTAGVRYLVRDGFMRTSGVYFAALNLVFQVLVYAIVLGVGHRRGGAAVVGAALSFAAVAGLAGSLVAARLQRRLRLQVLLAAGPAVAAVLLVVAWTADSDVAFVAAFSALCLLTPVIGAALGTIMAVAVPEEIYGRTLSAWSFTAELLQPLGPLAAGILLVAFSLPVVAAVLALTLALLACLALLLPSPTAPPDAGPALRRSP